MHAKMCHFIVTWGILKDGNGPNESQTFVTDKSDHNLTKIISVQTVRHGLMLFWLKMNAT